MSERDILLGASAHADPAARSAFLDAACGGDTALRERVERLLCPDAGDGPTRTLSPGAGDPDFAETRAPDGDGAADVNVAALLSPAQEEGSLGRLDHYEVLGVVGRGGMGVVLRAHDTRLRRVVAVKLLAPALAAVGTARKRFAREAQAAAAVRDEHVVDIHAVCEGASVPYLVMEFVAGVTLEDRVRAEGPLDPSEAVRIGLQSAQGLAAAHAQGLIHRDVKPGNILLEGGTGRVKLTDFGLARAADDASISRSGVIAGTPLYMSPEQAKGDHIDARSDLFSLGSVLYTLLTGKPAFRADSTVAVIRRVCKDTPRPIRESSPRVPRWVCAVVERLMAKDPSERIQTAAEVVDLLGRYLAHAADPDRVPPPPPVRGVRVGGGQHRGRRWVLRTVIAVAAVTVGTLGYLVLRPTGQPAAPVTNPPRVVDTGWKPPTAGELAARPSPLDGRLLALAGDSKPVPATGVAVLRAPKDAPVPMWAVAVSPDGRSIAAGCDSGTVLVWDLGAWATGTPQPPIRALSGHTATVYSVAFSPDGQFVASASKDGSIRLWGVVEGKPVRTLDGGKELPTSNVAFTADGKLVAAGDERGSVRLWDVATGEVRPPLRWHSQSVNAVALSPDGRFLASAGLNDRKVHVTDLKTMRRVQTLGPAGDGPAEMRVAFAGDGRTLAYGGWDATVRLWDLTEKKEAVLTGGGANPGALAVDPTGRFVAVARGATVRVWDRTEPNGPVTVGPGPFGAAAWQVAFTPEGRYLVVAGANGTVSVLRARSLLGPQSPDATKLGSADALKRLRAELEAGPASLADFVDADFARVPLTKADAAAARELLRNAHAARVRAERAAEWKDKVIRDGKLEMPFAYKTFGEKPKDGWSLYVSLHGGAGGSKATNDRVWEAQKQLYTVEQGIYLTPRAPTNNWNMWHESHIDRMLARLVEDFVAFEGVNPGRVYLLGGGSAGGDGVYQLAPRMADHWAAAAMTGGHSNSVSPLSLRNVPFSLQVGANDFSFNRNKVASEYGATLAQLRKSDRKGYETFVKFHEGKGTVLGGEDKVALPWMARFARDPIPERVVWKQTGIHPSEGSKVRTVLSPQHDRLYWLAVPPGAAKAETLVAATRAGQAVEIEVADGVSKQLIRLDDRMLDLDKPVKVTHGGKELFVGLLPRTIGVMVRTLVGRGDPELMFEAEVEVDPTDVDTSDAPTQTRLGVGLLKLGQSDQAAARFRKAIERDPKYAPAHDQLAAAVTNLGQLDEAIAGARKAIELDPTLANAHFTLGTALGKKRHWDEAVGCLRKAVELDPQIADVHLRLGFTLFVKNQPDEAAVWLRKAIELDPQETLAHAMLGFALSQKGENAGAAVSFRRAIELDSQHSLIPLVRTELAQAERVTAVQDKLPAFLAGEYKPETNEERIGLSELCRVKKRYRAVAGLEADIFAADPKLAADPRSVRRYNAACFAALAAAGQGDDAAGLDDDERARLRKLALDWLRADLGVYAKRLKSGLPADRTAALQALYRWQQDANLATVRDAAALDKLPAEERGAFAKLWEDAAAVLKEIREAGLPDDAELRRIAALPAAQQVEEVRKELKKRNPDFDGTLSPTIQGGAVIGLNIKTDVVTDIAPVRALTQLKRLDLIATGGTRRLVDLSPLKGLALTELHSNGNPVVDISPLKGMPLQHLMLWGWRGTDMRPLKGMPLKVLNCGGGYQKLDLTHLAGLPLENLCINFTQVTDLSPLKDMPLHTFMCANTPVADLTPLKGLPIRFLEVYKTKVSDLSPLKEMPLETFHCEDSEVTDLSALKGMLLKQLRCPFKPERDAETLRAIKTLERINDKPAAAFWKSAEKK